MEGLCASNPPVDFAKLRHPQIIPLDRCDPGVGDDHRHRLGRALGRRDERARRRPLEPLRDRMWQDALALADLDDHVPELAMLAVG